MCADCGCGQDGASRVTRVSRTGAQTGPEHAHPHDHSQREHPHLEHATPSSRTISIEQAVLAKNDGLAERNRAWLRERGISAVNLMSSPGSGKTSLLERTIRELSGPGTGVGNGARSRTVSVIEGDQETFLDAERIRATGAEVVQINTGAGCHLDAEMLARGLDTLAPPSNSLLFIENVGNLVCPALFDLGEAAKVVVISVTEGDDKPLKYPQMFAAADVVLVNKTDLLPYVDFDVQACSDRARLINPALEILALSVKTGNGINHWYDWIDRTLIRG